MYYCNIYIYSNASLIVVQYLFYIYLIFILFIYVYTSPSWTCHVTIPSGAGSPTFAAASAFSAPRLGGDASGGRGLSILVVSGDFIRGFWWFFGDWYRNIIGFIGTVGYLYGFIGAFWVAWIYRDLRGISWKIMKLQWECHGIWSYIYVFEWENEDIMEIYWI